MVTSRGGGSSGGDPSDVARALELLCDGTIEAGNYIAAVGGLEAAKDLIAAVREQRLEGKGVIYPHTRGRLRVVDGWDGGKEREVMGGRPGEGWGYSRGSRGRAIG